MGWIHDTGYRPAHRHEGFPASILTDRSVATDPTRITDPAEVIGWKAACTCGWRSPSVYMRTAFPSLTGDPPAAVTGQTTRTGAWAEWRHHLFTELPALILADVVSTALPPGTDVLMHPVVAAVVDIVREHGASWTAIAHATGVTARQARASWELYPPTARQPPRQAARHRTPSRTATPPRPRSTASPDHGPAARDTGAGCGR